MRESAHERYLRRWCKVRGIQCVKFVVKADKGWPDRMVLIPGLGYPLYIEMKRPKKEGSVVASCQQRKINWLVANGYCAAVCHTGKEAVAFVRLFWSDNDERVDASPVPTKRHKIPAQSHAAFR